MRAKYIYLNILFLPFFVYASIFSSDSIVHPEVDQNGMVVSQHYLASSVGAQILEDGGNAYDASCLLYTSPSPRDGLLARMPSSA